MHLLQKINVANGFSDLTEYSSLPHNIYEIFLFRKSHTISRFLLNTYASNSEIYIAATETCSINVF